MPLTYNEQMAFLGRFLHNKLNTNDAARANRIQNNQSQQKVYLHKDFAAIPINDADKTTRIGCLPQGISLPSNLELAPRPFYNRYFSRKRVIIGPVTFYCGGKPQDIHVITACAPNLGTDSQKDLDDFIKKNPAPGSLNEDAYRTECEKVADLILSSAFKEGIKKVIMPAFGVGLYIQKLNPASKEAAKTIMYDAFRQAATRYEIQVQWVVWGQARDKDDQFKFFEGLSDGNGIELVIGDFIDLSMKAAASGESVAVLNPGSDRTIGGRYVEKESTTAEEQLVHCSDLLFLQSSTFNKEITEQIKAQHARLQASSSGQGSSKMKEVVSSSLNQKQKEELAVKLQTLFELPKNRHNPWIGEDYISFRTKDQAESFRKQFSVANEVEPWGGANGNASFFKVSCDVLGVSQAPELNNLVNEKRGGASSSHSLVNVEGAFWKGDNKSPLLPKDKKTQCFSCCSTS